MSLDTSQLNTGEGEETARHRTLRRIVIISVAVLAVAVVIYLLIQRGQNQDAAANSATNNTSSPLDTNPVPPVQPGPVYYPPIQPGGPILPPGPGGVIPSPGNPPPEPVNPSPFAPPAPPVPANPPPAPPTPHPPAPVATQPSARTYVVQKWPAQGSTLSGIAQIEYGSPALWPKIYAANKGLIGSNPDLIQPGMHLVIPAA